MESKPIAIFKTKAEAKALTGGCTQTSKMPCESYSLPTEACITGAKLAKVAGSICSQCYANKGFYKVYEKTIKPAQHKRLESIQHEGWVPAMVKLIGKSKFFRWHDSGDIQSVEHLLKLVQIAELMPQTSFWLPTREYGIVKDFVNRYGRIPANLTIRLSAMFVDQPVKIPASLAHELSIVSANVHAKAEPVGMVCNAPAQGGECRECRACWDSSIKAVSYHVH
jgi:hypothetical protein